MYVYTRNNIGQIPFDVNHENTVIFSSKQEQESYFYNVPHVELSNQSYQRVNKGIIKIAPPVLDDKAIATFCDANYIAFKNVSFENKWFYAFVDRAEYINNNTVMLFYHIDVIQTYMFDWMFNQCLIEREHTTTDIAGQHTLPEQLETGPYRSYKASAYLHDESHGDLYMNNRFEYTPCVVLACALKDTDLDWSSEFDNYAPGVVVPGIATETGGYYSGVRYYPFLIYGMQGAQQGIYQFNFIGPWNVGDNIYINSAQNVVTVTQEMIDSGATWAAVAVSVRQFINNNLGSYYSAIVNSDGILVVYEQSGHYGLGIEIESFAGGQIYKYTVQPGSPDAEYGDINRLNELLVEINAHNRTDAIVGLYIMPYQFFPKTASEIANGVPPFEMRIICPDTIDLYTPRNKKLLCYPYNMLFEINGCGGDAEYKFEEFLKTNVTITGDTYEAAQFKIWGNLSANPGMYCAPYRYNGSVYEGGLIEQELVVNGFPMCSFNVDSFKAWMAQNTGTITAAGLMLVGSWVSAIGGGVLAGGALEATGAMSGGYIGQHLELSSIEQSLANRYSQGAQMPSKGLIASTLGALGQLYDHARTPPQIRGQSNGNLSYQAGQLTFTWYYKQIKQEYAKIIDSYFDMYGYKTNRVGTPNLIARPKYSYVKTIGCSLEGFIPGDFKAEIEAIFDKGIRFWKTSAVFGNFDPSVNNNMPV